MIDYTFLVLTYNQENLVIVTLESIKHQIVSYCDLSKKKIQLLICDDCSKDRTTAVIDKWLAANASLFALVTRSYLKENRGICYNYVQGIKQIQGKYFRAVAGDDALPCENLFPIFDYLDDYDLVTADSLLFDNDYNIHTNRSEIEHYMLIQYYNIKKIRKQTYYKTPILNGVIYKKELLTDTVLNHILNYKYLEDAPQWFKIFQENKNIRISHKDYYSLLYRQSNSSISGSGLSYGDYMKFLSDNDGNIPMLVKYSRKLRRSKHYKILKFIDPYYLEYAFIKLTHLKDIKRIWNIELAPSREKNQKFLLELKKASDEFMKICQL